MSQVKNSNSQWEERGVVRRLYLPDLAACCVAGGLLHLTGEEYHYAAHVLRLGPSEQLELFDGRGHYAAAGCELCSKKELVLAVGELLTADEIRGPLLAVGYCKRFDQVLEKATELGAAAVIPLKTERTAISAKEFNYDHFNKIILAAARQSKRYYLPELTAIITLDELLGRYQRVAAALPHGAVMAKLPFLPECLLIGPEGGFSPAELAKFKEKDIAAYGLGPHILRVETAALASLAAYWQAAAI